MVVVRDVQATLFHLCVQPIPIEHPRRTFQPHLKNDRGIHRLKNEPFHYRVFKFPSTDIRVWVWIKFQILPSDGFEQRWEILDSFHFKMFNIQFLWQITHGTDYSETNDFDLVLR